jgi:hypothetical protein
MAPVQPAAKKIDLPMVSRHIEDRGTAKLPSDSPPEINGKMAKQGIWISVESSRVWVMPNEGWTHCFRLGTT